MMKTGKVMDTISEVDKTYTVEQAAQALGVGIYTVKAALDSGRLACYRFNDAGHGKSGRTLIGASHLREYQTRSECRARAASK